jgi:phage-related protein
LKSSGAYPSRARRGKGYPAFASDHLPPRYLNAALNEISPDSEPFLATRLAQGYAIYLAQRGEKHVSAKPLKGLGSGVLEVVSDHRGDTFRSVYTVRFTDRVFVLHAFQKKSKSGIGTPKADIELIRQRLKQAIEMSKRKE